MSARNDTETLIATGLAGALGESVASIPLDGDRFLVVQRVGGAATSRVLEEVHLAIEAYAPRSTEAFTLVDRARAWCLEQAASVALTRYVRRVDEVSGPVDLPDPRRPDLARYSATLSFTVRRNIVG